MGLDEKNTTRKRKSQETRARRRAEKGNSALKMNNDVLRVLAARGCLEMLDSEGFHLGDKAELHLAGFVELVHSWNDFASLVSRSDLDSLIETHLIDSLSLAPVIKRKCRESGLLLDIGSGGGIPAIPIKIALPSLKIAMIERSERKVGFLRKACADLKLQGISIIHGDFPRCELPADVEVITARAVEKAGKIVEEILKFMPEKAVFLCQTPESILRIPPMFHVEHVRDQWQEKGLRRGSLRLITRTPSL
jgi:16S rRNA (guanine(527)-N(7))-methyltransferase RsmG